MNLQFANKSASCNNTVGGSVDNLWKSLVLSTNGATSSSIIDLLRQTYGERFLGKFKEYIFRREFCGRQSLLMTMR